MFPATHSFGAKSWAALVVLALSACAQNTPPTGKTELPAVHELARHEDDAAHHDDELLVLDPPADYLASLPELGLSIIDVTHLDGMDLMLYHLRIEDGKHPFHARQTHLDRHPEVIADVHHHFEQHATRKRKRKTKRKPNTSYNSRKASQWGAPAKVCGRGIHMGIVDGGVDTGHTAFKGRDIKFRAFHRKGEEVAANNHGTAVASMQVGGNKWGSLLPDAKLSAAGVFHKNRKGKSRASAKSILQAVNWLIKQKVQIINFSIGGSKNRLMQRAVEKADELGIILIASAGNNGPFTKKKSYPAAYPQVIAVAASDPFDRVARFSSAGDYVEFTTPGVGIWTAVPGGGKNMSGTSFSSPIFAGFTAAAMKYKGIAGTETIRTHFREIVKARGRKKWDKYSGWGFIRSASPC